MHLLKSLNYQPYSYYLSSLRILGLSKYSPVKIGIFGSYARGDDNDSSDIDILVDFKEQVSLFDLGGIKYDLTELLNRSVDIVTERSVNSRIRDYINRDLKIIYE